MKLIAKNKLVILLVLSLTIFALAGCSNDQSSDESESAPANTEVNEDNSNYMSIEEAKENYENDEYVFVDTRINDAYNGWALDGVKMGGHIPGAVDFAFNWLNVEKENLDEEIAKVLETKGITKDKSIVLYDANGQDALKVFDYLTNLGYEKVSLLDLNQWIDAEMALEKMPNYQLIVPAEIVKSVLDGNKPETFEDAKNIKVVEASWGEEKTSYAKGHVPGTFHINTDAIEPPPEWMLGSPEVLNAFALKHGFTTEDTVIVTGADQLAAYRVAVVLEYMGVKDARVLNGGLAAWKAAGYEVETDRHDPVEVESFGAQIPVREEVITTIPELKEFLKQDSFTLVDNRTWDEHIGKISGYSYHEIKGRIPGSVYGYAGLSDAYSLDYFRNIDNTMRNPEEIKELWAQQGISLDNHLSFMCGSGWRAAEVLVYSRVMGVEKTSLYSDGWIGWSNNPENPIETGEPK